MTIIERESARIRASDGLAMRRRHLHRIAIKQIVIVAAKPPGAITYLCVSGLRGDIPRAIFENVWTFLDWVQRQIGGITSYPKDREENH